MYAALYESAAAHSRLGLNVVMDVGHHDSYSRPLGVLRDCAKLLQGLPAVLVGVRCPIEVILARRNADQEGRQYVKATPDDPVPEPVAKWQHEVHVPGVYDLEVDTSLLSPSECAERIRAFLENGVPEAFEKLAEGSPTQAADPHRPQ
jgi:chloramphenicol 3-O phosphotransferase